MWDREMQAALFADGAKLSAMTGEDHMPYFFDEGPDYFDAIIEMESYEAMAINVGAYDDWFVE